MPPLRATRLLSLSALLLLAQHCAPGPCMVQASNPNTTTSWEELTKPSSRHALFDAMKGTFEARSRFWVYPGAKPGSPPGESKALVVNTLDFGGRFLVQDYRVPDGTLHGVAYFGFDNLAGRFQYVWLDSAITSIETMSGVADDSGRTVTFRADEIDPITRKKIAVRLVLHVTSDTVHSLARYETGADGHEVKSLETVYTRQP